MEVTVDPHAHAPALMAAELLGGVLGALGGGVGGFLLGFFLCLGSVSDDPYASLGCIGAGALGYLAGTPLGAVAGVHITAGLSRVEGDLWLGLLGAVAGEGAAVFLFSRLGGLGSDALGPAFVFGAIPVATALGAVWGYNVHAKVLVMVTAP